MEVLNKDERVFILKIMWSKFTFNFPLLVRSYHKTKIGKHRQKAGHSYLLSPTTQLYSVENARKSFKCCWLRARRKTSQFCSLYNPSFRRLSLWHKVSWNKRDLLLYAIGIGATSDDSQFVYGVQCAVSSYCCHWPRVAELGWFYCQNENLDNSSLTFQIPSLPLFLPTLLCYLSNSMTMMWTCSRIVQSHLLTKLCVLITSAILTSSTGTCWQISRF